jgi:hypothetical protein
VKEDYGANYVMVGGHNKASLHLMSGIIALFLYQFLRLRGQVVKDQKSLIVLSSNCLFG